MPFLPPNQQRKSTEGSTFTQFFLLFLTSVLFCSQWAGSAEAKNERFWIIGNCHLDNSVKALKSLLSLTHRVLKCVARIETVAEQQHTFNDHSFRATWVNQH